MAQSYPNPPYPPVPAQAPSAPAAGGPAYEPQRQQYPAQFGPAGQQHLASVPTIVEPPGPHDDTFPVARVHEQAAGPKPALPVPNMAGTWMKDKAASDPIDPLLDLKNIKGMKRAAIKFLAKGVHIKQTTNKFSVSFISCMPFLKVKQKFKLTGEEATFKRTDLRKGPLRGRLRLLPPDPAFAGGVPAQPLPALQQPPSLASPAAAQAQGRAWAQGQTRVALDYRWEEPYAGSSTEVYELREPDVLTITVMLRVGQREVLNRQLLRRKEPSLITVR